MKALTRIGAATLAVAGILAGAVGAAPALASGGDHPGFGPPGFGPPGFGHPGFGPNHAVFVQTDGLAGNQIVAYDRAGDGTLTQAGIYNTGGNGGQLSGSVVDHTASQGALTYDRADNLLFAVNAGSNTVSVFAVFGDQLALRQVIGSGGKFPVSVTVHQGTVYVLNAEEGGSIQGYAVVFDHLALIPGSHRSLGLATGNPGEATQFVRTPGQVAFSPDGSKLIVTTKAAGQSIEVFTAYPWGGLSQNPVVNSDETVPFAVTFDPQGHLLVAEAAGALASFQLNENGTVTELDSVKTEQEATCWLTPAAGYYYTSNAGSATLSGFASTPGAQLTLLGNTATSPGTVDGASVGNFLYVQGGKEGTIDEFKVQADGALEHLGSLTVPDAAGGEGIVAT
jgi:6-phosphogluconolactonase (cycloisomerase 2 family)